MKKETEMTDLQELRRVVQEGFRQSPEATLMTIRKAIIEGFRQVQAGARDVTAGAKRGKKGTKS